MKLKLFLTAIFLSTLFLSGCDDDDNSFVDVDGIWSGNVEILSSIYDVRLTVVQSGNALSATTINQETGEAHHFTGTVTNDYIYLISVEGNTRREYNLNLIYWDTLSGTYISTDLTTNIIATGTAVFGRDY